MKKDFIEEVAWSCEEKKGTAAVLLCFEWLLDKKSLSVIRKVDYDYRTHTLEVYRDKERRVLKTVAKLTERTAKALELAFEEMEMLVHEINQGKDVRKIRNSDYLFQSRKTGDGYSEAEENVIGKGAVEGAFYNVAKCYFKKSNGKYELKELEKMIKLRNIKESGKCYLCAKYKDINYILSLVNETRKQTFVRAQAYSPRLYPELYE